MIKKLAKLNAPTVVLQKNWKNVDKGSSSNSNNQQPTATATPTTAR